MNWRKSTYSAPDGDNCVEVATKGPVIAVRDSKHPGEPHLVFGRSAFEEFARRLRGR
ncbi:DUF397 domain-containing protein [Actinocorallia aurea]